MALSFGFKVPPYVDLSILVQEAGPMSETWGFIFVLLYALKSQIFSGLSLQFHILELRIN